MTDSCSSDTEQVSIAELFQIHSGINPDIVTVENIEKQYETDNEGVWVLELSFDCEVSAGVITGTLSEEFDGVESTEEMVIRPNGTISVSVTRKYGCVPV